MTKVLITGGFGFVGGRLALHLESQGFEVILGSRLEREPFRGLRRARSVITDWSNDESLEEACRSIDVVVHCAGLDAGSCANDPELAYSVNTRNTERIGLVAESAGVRRLLYISTAHVYRSPLVGHLDETSPTVNQHPYAMSNRLAEVALLEILSRGRIEIANIRLSNAFGVPATDTPACWDLVVNDLCRQSVTLKAMALKASQDEWRNFIGLDAVSQAVRTLIQLRKVPPTMNLGGHDLRLSGVADLIGRRVELLLGYRPTVSSLFAVSDASIPDLRFSCDLAGEWLGRGPGIEHEIDSLVMHCSNSTGRR